MPCPCHQLMYNPAMGSSSWGAGLWLVASRSSLQALGPKSFQPFIRQ